MDLTGTLADTAHPNGESTLTSTRELASSAGRSVQIVHNGQQDEIQVRSPQGEVEVRIILTEQGPVVRLQAARLELESVDEIDLTCRRLKLHAREEARIVSDGQLRLFAAEQLLLRSKEDMDLKGRPIRYNVRDGRFYDDYVPAANGERWGTAFEGVQVDSEADEDENVTGDLQRCRSEVERFEEILSTLRHIQLT